MESQNFMSFTATNIYTYEIFMCFSVASNHAKL